MNKDQTVSEYEMGLGLTWFFTLQTFFFFCGGGGVIGITLSV